ncbi:MAG: hypothetical protein LBP75_03475 [Planctomycetota bacterium]|nr:hypothetical protein [Planctomycetota bacterium]
MDGSPCFGEPLSPPEAAFAAANRAAGLSDGCSATFDPGLRDDRACRLPWANIFRPCRATVGVFSISSLQQHQR